MELAILIGAIVSFIGLLITAYKVGRHLSTIEIENKGHEEIEKKLIQQTNDYENITRKYNDLRNKLLNDKNQGSDLPETPTPRRRRTDLNKDK